MQSLHHRTTFLLILILSFLVLQACIPVPAFWEKDRYSEEDISTITKGLSNKNDVLKKFGQPDVIWELEESKVVFIYQWQRLRAIFFVFGGNTGAGLPIRGDDTLLILFDDAGVVKRVGKATREYTESYGDFLMRWLKQSED